MEFIKRLQFVIIAIMIVLFLLGVFTVFLVHAYRTESDQHKVSEPVPTDVVDAQKKTNVTVVKILDEMTVLVSSSEGIKVTQDATTIKVEDKEIDISGYEMLSYHSNFSGKTVNIIIEFSLIPLTK